MASRSEKRRQRQNLAAVENRGGPRTGTPGSPYANRTDMRAPPTAAPDQTYGTAGAQLAAQRAVPMAGGGNQFTPAQAQAGQLGAQAQQLPGLTDPTARPNEPLTTGIPSGAGAGPEALAPPPNPLVKAAAALNALGDTADADTAALRTLVNTALNNQSAA